ncbi:hypothetical protein DFJ58DRAFT_628027, partial [Suillus subalutaceus]|uniref:uncharacterized protein n=1 Tax=Suillus subalutaceus TaxID=48586 RepID=UPI001B885FBB
WSLEDEKEFIAYIKENHAKGGDGLNFDRTFWNQVAAHLAPITTSGVVGTGDACSTKWTHLCTVYTVIDRVAHYSGV